MKTKGKIVAILLFACILFTYHPGKALADCAKDGQEGIWLGTIDMFSKYTWTFSLINFTKSNVSIGAKGSTEGHDLGSDFPYGHVYPPGNSTPKYAYPPPDPLPTGNGDTSKIGLTTWRSNSHNKMFPDHCQTTVPILVQDGSNAYNFALLFAQDLNYNAQKAVIVSLVPPYKTTTWKYTMSSDNNGYASYAPRKNSTDKDAYEGILVGISDNYVITLYRTGSGLQDNGKNDLILVITEKTSKYEYHGNKLQWAL